MRTILNLLRGRRARLENDLGRELRFHFDRRVEDLRSQGLREGDARKQAAIEMGGIEQVQEDVRETWTLRRLEDAARDVRYAARSLARSPGFTATAVLSLAIGVGASAAIFSLADQILFRLLPVREPERLVAVDWKGNNLSHGWGPGAYMSYPLCRDLMKQDRFFDGVLCRFPTGVLLASGEGGQAEPVGAEIVSGSYFRMLGVVPALGRLLEHALAGSGVLLKLTAYEARLLKQSQQLLGQFFALREARTSEGTNVANADEEVSVLLTS